MDRRPRPWRACRADAARRWPTALITVALIVVVVFRALRSAQPVPIRRAAPTTRTEQLADGGALTGAMPPTPVRRDRTRRKAFGAVTVLGLVLLAVAVGLGVAAFGLYETGQPGNPRVQTSPNDAIYFSVPHGITASWRASFGIDATFSKIEDSSIVLSLSAKTIPAATTTVSVGFRGSSAVEGLEVTTTKFESVAGTDEIRIHEPRTMAIRFAETSDGQQFTFDTPPGAWWGVRPESNAALITMKFRFRHRPIARESGRVVIALPSINAPGWCSDIDPRTGRPVRVACGTAQDPTFKNKIRLHVPADPVRVDYMNPLPEPNSQYQWTSNDSIQVQASLALITEEALGQRYLFLSGLAAGVATTFLALGLEILIKWAAGGGRGGSA